MTSWTEILSGVSGTEQALNIADFKSKYSEFQVVMVFDTGSNDDYMMNLFSSTKAISASRNTIFSDSRYYDSSENRMMSVTFTPSHGTAGGFLVRCYNKTVAETNRSWKLYAR